MIPTRGGRERTLPPPPPQDRSPTSKSRPASSIESADEAATEVFRHVPWSLRRIRRRGGGSGRSGRTVLQAARVQRRRQWQDHVRRVPDRVVSRYRRVLRRRRRLSIPRQRRRRCSSSIRAEIARFTHFGQIGPGTLSARRRRRRRRSKDSTGRCGKALAQPAERVAERDVTARPNTGRSRSRLHAPEPRVDGMPTTRERRRCCCCCDRSRLFLVPVRRRRRDRSPAELACSTTIATGTASEPPEGESGEDQTGDAADDPTDQSVGGDGVAAPARSHGRRSRGRWC